MENTIFLARHIEGNASYNVLYACKLKNFTGVGWRYCRVLKTEFYILHKDKSTAGKVRLDSG